MFHALWEIVGPTKRGAWALLLFIAAQLAPARAEEPASRLMAAMPPLSPAAQQALFHLPSGFEIELVAAEPQIRKPINLSFDAAGRILVTGSVEYPRPAGAAPRDAITILADTDRDGRFERADIFAADLNIPVGVTPVPGGVLAFSIPSIVLFSDARGAGRAPHKRILFSSFDFRDTHGMPNAFTRWLDGWVYACHGEGNISTVAGADGRAITLRGGTMFRMQADGSRIEPFAFGPANPFGLCFDEWGDVFAADSHSRPATLLLRGATYPNLGQASDALGFGPQLMAHHHGSTGIGGIAVYAADQFPAAYRNALFIGNPVAGRINRDRLERRGSTYVALEEPDFVRCDDPWFRPVDLKLGPDGALYIADFYDRTIATSPVPLGQPERDRERGRIWRVVYRGINPASERQTFTPAPNLATAPVDELLARLRDANLTVRTLATHELVDRIGHDAVAAVTPLMTAENSHYLVRVHAIWVLQRLRALGDDLLASLAGDAHAMVRVQALRVLAERADWTSVPGDFWRQLVLEKLADEHPLVRRAAADALLCHPSPASVEPLLALWETAPREDTMLIHVARMALRASLQSGSSIGELAQPLSPEKRRKIADVCLGIRTPQAADFLLAQLTGGKSDPERLGDVAYHITRYVNAESLTRLTALWLTYAQKDAGIQATVLSALYRAYKDRAADVPEEIADWAGALVGQLLNEKDEAAVYQGLELALDLRLLPSRSRLEQLAGPASAQSSLRSFAIDVYGAVALAEAVPLLGRMLADTNEAADIREKVADSLGKIDSPASRDDLQKCLPTAPAGLAVVVARSLAHSRAGAVWLLDAVRDGKASARLLQDALVEQGLRAASIENLDARLKTLLAGLPDPVEQLATRIQSHQERFAKATPDLPRGAAVFERHCANCHQLALQGQRVGPALTGIGQRGIERILEDVLDPQRNVDASFRSTLVRLTDGRSLTGLVLREDADSLVLADSAGKETRVSVREIEERKQLTTSPMAGGWDQTIPASEFDDLLAYLLSQRQ